MSNPPAPAEISTERSREAAERNFPAILLLLVGAFGFVALLL